MINNLMKTALILFLAIFTSGCASNVKLQDSFWKDHKQKVLIVHEATPVASVMGGTGDVVGGVVHATLHHKLENYLSTIDMAWYNHLGERFADKLNARQISAINHPYPMRYYVSKDYLLHAKNTQSDKVIIYRVTLIGASRKYLLYVPVGAPKVVCQITAELRNVSDNKVLWSHTSGAMEVIEGEWDQPPNYPNLTAALKRAINNTQDRLLDNFFDGKMGDPAKESIIL